MRVESVVMSSSDNTQRLERLTQPHVVTQDTVQSELTQEPQPVYSVLGREEWVTREGEGEDFTMTI